MILLLDLGNSRLKWACWVEKQLAQSHAVAYDSENLFYQQVHHQWSAFSKVEAVLVSSVANKDIEAMLFKLAAGLWPEVVWHKASAQPQNGNLCNAYTQPEKLGVDRWLVMLAVNHYYSGSSMVVDLGTAMTIDYISAQGQHLGGLICPGLALMMQSLEQGTATLSKMEINYDMFLADSTADAIGAGLIYAMVGAIEKVYQQYVPENLVLCGGDARVIGQKLSLSHSFDQDLVLKGLALYFQAVIKQ